ncbi:MAG: leucine-rich repeat domain-containing protein [Ruminococcus sp.]|nr:leucine-rich repeat domain-containing protein [Ruminococcus sp.]
MKKVLCALLACALCATTASAFAGCGCSDSSTTKTVQPGYEVPTTVPDLKDDQFGYFILSNNELMITRYDGDSQDVKIPETFNNYTVSVIGNSVFQQKKLKSVEIPDTIKEIQDYCFASNPDLKTVKMSNSVKTLGADAFFNCPALESIELPETIESVGVYAFTGTGMTSVTIPESSTFTSIDQYTFSECQNLKEVVIPATVTDIADNAFNACPNKITIKAPAGSYAINYANQHGFDAEEL